MKRALVIVALALACSPAVDRDRWMGMSRSEKTLYVSSLIGAEAAARAKGGAKDASGGNAEDIVAAIEVAYASGDQRRPEEIFRSLRPRPQPPSPRAGAREGDRSGSAGTR